MWEPYILGVLKVNADMFQEPWAAERLLFFPENSVGEYANHIALFSRLYTYKLHNIYYLYLLFI